MSFVIGVDIGTGSTKAVLSTLDGEVVAVARRDHAPSLPQPGWAEMDPERDWWGDVVEVLAELDTTDVAAVCVSGLGPCVVQTDDDLRPRRPAILYGVDTRSTREIAEITEQLGAGAILERCGKDLSSQAIGPKLAWLRRAAGYAWQPQDRWFSAHTYVVARLTGEWVLDHHTASQCDRSTTFAGRTGQRIGWKQCCRVSHCHAWCGRPNRWESYGGPPRSRPACPKGRLSSLGPSTRGQRRSASAYGGPAT